MNKKNIGDFYESKAINYLKSINHKIICKNYNTKYGEIDIISYDRKEKCIVFTEVRYRKTASFGSPQETITIHKQKRIILSAICYLKSHHTTTDNIRFDVISFTAENQMEHIKNAFQVDCSKIYI